MSRKDDKKSSRQRRGDKRADAVPLSGEDEMDWIRKSGQEGPIIEAGRTGRMRLPRRSSHREMTIGNAVKEILLIRTYHLCHSKFYFVSQQILLRQMS